MPIRIYLKRNPVSAMSLSLCEKIKSIEIFIFVIFGTLQGCLKCKPILCKLIQGHAVNNCRSSFDCITRIPRFCCSITLCCEIPSSTQEVVVCCLGMEDKDNPEIFNTIANTTTE